MTQEAIPLKLAAKRTALSEANIRYGMKQGTIQGHKLGRDWYLPVAEVERLAREYPLSEGAHGQS